MIIISIIMGKKRRQKSQNGMRMGSWMQDPVRCGSCRWSSHVPFSLQKQELVASCWNSPLSTHSHAPVLGRWGDHFVLIACIIVCLSLWNAVSAWAAPSQAHYCLLAEHLAHGSHPTNGSWLDGVSGRTWGGFLAPPAAASLLYPSAHLLPTASLPLPPHSHTASHGQIPKRENIALN